MNYDECYKICTVRELKDSLASEKRDIMNYDDQLQTNFAYVYYLQSGATLLLPNSRNDNEKALYFTSKECFRHFFDNDKFPIKNSSMSILEKNEDVLLNFSKNKQMIFDSLCRIVGDQVGIDISDPKVISALLMKLKGKKQQIDLTGKLFFALALGEFVRIKNHGNWIFLKIYGEFNPYYVPAIQYSNKRFVLILDRFEVFYDNNKMSADEFSKLKRVKQPINTSKNTYAYEYILLSDKN